MKSMDLQTVKNRIEAVNTLATIPTVANRLMELVSDPSVSVTEISQFISGDPVLTTKTLRMVSSPCTVFPEGSLRLTRRFSSLASTSSRVSSSASRFLI